jgi:hypothetical protein
MKAAALYVLLLATGTVGYLALDPGTEPAPARITTLTPRLDERGMPMPDLGPEATARYAGPGAMVAPALTGVTPIGSDFDRAHEIVRKRAPTGSDAGPIGAFRFICQPGQLNWDDPIVYPGQPNASPHLHQWFGNTGGNALSTYASLRSDGESTCMGPLNRSAYWMPAMIAGEDTVVRPDYLVVYYKRYPKAAPECRETARECLPLPHGLRYIFGYDMLRMGEDQPENRQRLFWKCVTPGNRTLGETRKNFANFHCPVDHLLMVTFAAPDCWDGKNLDSADHRSHMAYQAHDGTAGPARCPASHPYLLPQFTLSATWKMRPGDDLAQWRLASDQMPGMPALPPGASMHSDWFGAWDPETLRTWTANCIDAKKSCVDGDLGDGTGMKRPASFGYLAEPRLVR